MTGLCFYCRFQFYNITRPATSHEMRIKLLFISQLSPLFWHNLNMHQLFKISQFDRFCLT